MTTKQVGILAIISVLVVAGAPIGYVAWNNSKQQTNAVTSLPESEAAKPRVASPSSESSSSGNSTLSVTNRTGAGQALGAQTQPTTNTTSGASNDSFAEYESYKDETRVYYADFTEGTGSFPTNNKRVAVTYKGYLTDGTLFDQSRPDENGDIEPFVYTHAAGEVIQGWDLGLADMKVGGYRRLVIPPSLGYGSNGVDGIIPPDSVLIFDVELLEVEP